LSKLIWHIDMVPGDSWHAHVHENAWLEKLAVAFYLLIFPISFGLPILALWLGHWVVATYLGCARMAYIHYVM